MEENAAPPISRITQSSFEKMTRLFRKKLIEKFADSEIYTTFAVPSLTKREHSSAGSEHLPYKQRVRGSNPFAPTTISHSILIGWFFCVVLGCVVSGKPSLLA